MSFSNIGMSVHTLYHRISLQQKIKKLKIAEIKSNGTVNCVAHIFNELQFNKSSDFVQYFRIVTFVQSIFTK